MRCNVMNFYFIQLDDNNNSFRKQISDNKTRVYMNFTHHLKRKQTRVIGPLLLLYISYIVQHDDDAGAGCAKMGCHCHFGMNIFICQLRRRQPTTPAPAPAHSVPLIRRRVQMRKEKPDKSDKVNIIFTSFSAVVPRGLSVAPRQSTTNSNVIFHRKIRSFLIPQPPRRPPCRLRAGPPRRPTQV